MQTILVAKMESDVTVPADLASCVAFDLQGLAELDYSADDDWRHRHWLREDGFDDVVKGALRLAAHKILGEQPAFAELTAKIGRLAIKDEG